MGSGAACIRKGAWGCRSETVCRGAAQIKKHAQELYKMGRLCRGVGTGCLGGCSQGQGGYVNICVRECVQEAWCGSRRVHRGVAG